MNFRSEVSSRASRPSEAMVWMNEIETAKSVADLETSSTITGQSCRQTSRILIQKKKRGLNKVINGDFKGRVFSEEEAAQQGIRFLTGRQVAWMIYENFKVSDTDESVLDLN